MYKENIASWPGWETVRLIGRGSFGAVYEIQRQIFDDVEKAALKVISIPQNASDVDEMYSDGYDSESITATFHAHLKSIVAEYSLMRKMNGSANIVNCDDVRYVQHDDGIGWDIFIKMELLTPLTKALPACVSDEIVIKIAKDMCAALDLCKKFEIIHRDIKPQNIFVSEHGDYKLGDFGIAKTVERTMGGTKIGTYKYMAPEVYNNQPYGSAADIYSLGLVLYWALNERRMPFLPLPPEKLTAGADESARNRRLAGEPLPPPAHGSKELQRIVLKACTYEPANRYSSALEMLNDLKALAGETPVHAAQDAPEVPVSVDDDVITPPPVVAGPVLADADEQDAEVQTDETMTVGPAWKKEEPDVSEATMTTGPVWQKDPQSEVSPAHATSANAPQSSVKKPYTPPAPAKAEDNAAAETPSANKTRKRKKPIGIIILALLCVVSCVFAAVWMNRGDAGSPSFTPPVENNTPQPPYNVDNNKTDNGNVNVTPPTEAPKESVTIRFWQAGGEATEVSTVMRYLLGSFETKYPWITVEYQPIPWSNDPHYQFVSAIASGDVADVLVVGAPLDFQLASEGNILPLDDILTDEVSADISSVLKSECVYKGTANSTMTGKMMSVPLYGGTRAILYNKEIFDYFKQPYPTEQLSHTELLELAKKLTGSMNGKKVYGYGTRATDSAQYLNFMWNYGAQMIDAATMTAATDTPAWKKGVEDYLKFYKEGVTPRGSSTMSASTQLEMFLNGEIAMFIAGIDLAQTIRAEDGWGEKLGVAALVGQTYATSYCGADVLVVPAATRHKEEAALLVNYLLSIDAQVSYCMITGFFPVTISAANDPYFQEDSILAGYADAMAGAHYYGNYGVSVGSILRKHMQQLLNGEVTVDQYIKNLTADIQSAIDEKYG